MLLIHITGVDAVSKIPLALFPRWCTMKLSVRTGFQGVDGNPARSKRELTGGQLTRQSNVVSRENTVNLGDQPPNLERRIRETTFFKNFQNFPTHKSKKAQGEIP